MLEFKPLASGSSGNAYVVSDGTTDILLEAGIPFKKVQQLMDFETSKLKAVLVTHSHGDHVNGLKTFIERGTKVYMSKGTKEEMGLTAHNVKVIELDETRSLDDARVYKPFRVGTFTIQSFGSEHDTAESISFLIQSDNGKRLFFLTDSYYCRFNVSGVHIFATECNYDTESLEKSVQNGLHPAQKKRVMRSHMGLNTLTEFFKANDLSKCEHIYLLHLSDRNANRETIFTEVAKVTGKAITIVG